MGNGKICLAAVFMTMLLLGETCAITVTTVLQPGPEEGKDAYIDYQNPSNNYGNSQRLYVNNIWNFMTLLEERNMIIQFGLDELNIPPDATNINAELRLNSGEEHPFEIEDCMMRTWALSSQWNEETVNWLNQPSVTMPSGSAYYLYDNWYGWDITNYLNAWLAGTLENNGIQLAGAGIAGWTPPTCLRLVELYSSDFQNSELRPKLVVTWEEPEPQNPQHEN